MAQAQPAEQQQLQQSPPPYSQHQQQQAVYLAPPTPVSVSAGRGSRSARKVAMLPTKVADINPPVGRPADHNHSLIAMVVDRSGSMQSFGPEVHGGVNAYLNEQRESDASDGGRTSVMLTTFDNRVELVHDFVDIGAVPAVTAADVAPRGSTALYDAIGGTLVAVCKHLHTLDHAPKVVVFVLTDGAENSSQSWNSKRIKDEITRLQQAPYEFDFYFAAANQDALAVGGAMGVDRDACMTYSSTPKGITSAFKAQCQAQGRRKKGGMKGYLMSERQMCAEEE